MPFQVSAGSLSDTSISQAHFGANVLGLKDRLGDEGTFDNVASALGVEHLRYPGGSLTEHYFSITDPDSNIAVNHWTGEETEFLPISDFMTYAEQEGIAVTLVLPTRIFLGEELDAQGNRLPDIDEDALRGFLRDVFDGRYGAPEIQAIELGNEYWGSGHMNTFEYGRLAADMAVIVKEEMLDHPDAEHFVDTDILVQMGLNYGTASFSGRFDGTGEEQLDALNETYGLNLSAEEYIYASGNVAWVKVANAIIINEFDTSAEQDAIDGVVGHIYSKGLETPNSRYFELSQVADTWLEDMPDLDVYATEWNLKRSVSEDETDEFGLQQAHEMLNIIEAFSWGGVDAAHVWPLQMNSRTGLADGEGDADIRVPGEMFRLMNETLPGTRPLALVGSEGRETEITGDSADVHVFYAPDRMVTFLASTSDEASQEIVDFANIVRDAGDVYITRLGVSDGENPSLSTATPVVTEENPDDFIKDGILIADLAPYEILMIEMLNPILTAEAAALTEDPLDLPDFSEIAAPDDYDAEWDDTSLPMLPPIEERYEDPEEAASAADETGGDDFGIGALALAFLPILLLAA